MITVQLDTREAVGYIDQVIALLDAGILSPQCISDSLPDMLETLASLIRVVEP